MATLHSLTVTAAQLLVQFLALPLYTLLFVFELVA
jgi:NADP-dependent 3-hydroxy acid dehydrogenase YdfG